MVGIIIFICISYFTLHDSGFLETLGTKDLTKLKQMFCLQQKNYNINFIFLSIFNLFWQHYTPNLCFESKYDRMKDFKNN